MRRPWILSAGLVAVAACATSKEPSYYALAPVTGAAHTTSAELRTKAPALVELRRPSVAGYLDRSDIVMRVRDHQLRIDTERRWAEPLGDMISRVLARDLSSRLGESRVFMESGAISLEPEATVAVDILGFDSDDRGRLTLVAQVAVEFAGATRTARVESFTLTRPLPSDGARPAELASAMSALLADLADDVAAMLRAER